MLSRQKFLVSTAMLLAHSVAARAQSLMLLGAGGSTWTPTTLFGTAGSDGAWLAPDQSATLARNTAITLPARYNGTVQGIRDLSGKGNNPVQATRANAPRYASDVATGKNCVWFKQGFDTLGFTFGASMGSNVTIVFANGSNVQFLTGQTVNTTYSLAKTFFQFLIINRALTTLETAQVQAYFQTKCPNYFDSINLSTFYVDAVNGSDANNGLTRVTAKQTFAAATAQLIASATGSKLCVLPGTYNQSFDTTAGTINKTHYIYCPLAGVVNDMGGTPGGGSTSCIETEANGYTLNVFGDGNLTLQNIQNNGFGVHGSSTLNGYDTLITAADDGMSVHDTGTLRTYRCTVTNCTKSAVAHVSNTNVTSTAYHEFCALYGRLGATIGVALLGEKGVNFDVFGCDFLPDPATTSTWTAFFVGSNSANTGTGTTRSCRSCRFGNPSVTVGAAAIWTFYNTAFSDCYVGGVYLASAINGSANTMLRCYGKWTIRPRFVTADWGLDNCVWVGTGTASSQENGRAINGNFYNGTTDTYGTGNLRNSIIVNTAGVAIFATSNTAVFNANWGLTNQCLNGNLSNYTVGITPDGTDITSDPLLTNPTTDEEQDYYVAANSPCVGAGIGGTNIGLGVVS